MSDITCAHCGEPWDAYGLRHEGWEYLGDWSGPLPEKVTMALEHAYAGDERNQAALSNWLYRAVLSGKGCPHKGCGFKHQGEGKYREQQLHELVFDGVTDDDPTIFM